MKTKNHLFWQQNSSWIGGDVIHLKRSVTCLSAHSLFTYNNRNIKQTAYYLKQNYLLNCERNFLCMQFIHNKIGAIILGFLGASKKCTHFCQFPGVSLQFLIPKVTVFVSTLSSDLILKTFCVSTAK